MPPAEKRKVHLELGGRRFTIRSDDDDAYLGSLSQFINDKITAMRRNTGKVETAELALLVLLDVTDELFRERDHNDVLKSDVQKRAQALLGAIDQIAEQLEVRESVVAAAATAPRHSS